MIKSSAARYLPTLKTERPPLIVDDSSDDESEDNEVPNDYKDDNAAEGEINDDG